MPYTPAITPTLTTDEPAPEALAFAAVMDVLVDDPGLQACGTKIVTYSSGPDESQKTKPQPNVEDLPYCRVMLERTASNRETERTHVVRLFIGFELFVRGPSETDLLNFAHRVRRALKPTDPALYAAARTKLTTQGHVGERITIQLSKSGSIGQSEHGLTTYVVLEIVLEVNT